MLSRVATNLTGRSVAVPGPHTLKYPAALGDPRGRRPPGHRPEFVKLTRLPVHNRADSQTHWVPDPDREQCQEERLSTPRSGFSVLDNRPDYVPATTDHPMCIAGVGPTAADLRMRSQSPSLAWAGQQQDLGYPRRRRQWRCPQPEDDRF